MIVSHSFHGSFSLTSFPLNNAAFLFFRKKIKNKIKKSPRCALQHFSLRTATDKDWLTSYRMPTLYSYSGMVFGLQGFNPALCWVPHCVACLKTPPQVVLFLRRGSRVFAIVPWPAADPLDPDLLPLRRSKVRPASISRTRLLHCNACNAAGSAQTPHHHFFFFFLTWKKTTQLHCSSSP